MSNPDIKHIAEIVTRENFQLARFLEAFGINLPTESRGLVTELKLEASVDGFSLLTLKRYVTLDEVNALMDELRAGQTNLQTVKHSRI